MNANLNTTIIGIRNLLLNIKFITSLEMSELPSNELVIKIPKIIMIKISSRTVKFDKTTDDIIRIFLFCIPVSLDTYKNFSTKDFVFFIRQY